MSNTHNTTAKFIAVEGIEGCGKTTSIQYIKSFLATKGITDIHCTREPGGTTVGEKIRDILKTIDNKQEIADPAECLLFYASRSQLIKEIIKPKLQANHWVISDRYNLSSLAYQGHGKNLTELTTALTNIIIKDCKPDLTIVLDIDPEVGFARIKNRGALDRIEQNSMDFFKKARDYFISQAQTDPNTVLVDANQPTTSVKQQINAVLEEKYQKWM